MGELNSNRLIEVISEHGFSKEDLARILGLVLVDKLKVFANVTQNYTYAYGAAPYSLNLTVSIAYDDTLIDSSMVEFQLPKVGYLP